ncbi:hypothetical protein DFS33DRAFT_1338523 [Desarmillaria ectypa]|nr:hypothetical protein DFS33DRAFT_1338523 [Desarmillaria ectypa]
MDGDISAPIFELRKTWLGPIPPNVSEEISLLRVGTRLSFLFMAAVAALNLPSLTREFFLFLVAESTVSIAGLVMLYSYILMPVFAKVLLVWICLKLT